jgi:hypothetical protein
MSQRMSIVSHSGQAQRRLTYRYHNGWKDLDQYEDLGWRWHVLGTARVEEHSWESITLRYWVRVSRLVTRAEMAAAMSAEFNAWCRCEHDCCGHYQWHVITSEIRKIKRREWVVPIRALRNV